MRDRLKMSRRAVAGAVVALLALLLVVAVAAGSNPRACANCHEREAAALGESAHADLSCYRCHLEAGAWSFPGFKSDELLRMYPGALLGREGKGPVASLSSAPCLSCHADVIESEKPTEARGLRILHRACTAGLATCDSCHSTTAHGDVVRSRLGPVMEDCVSCHTSKEATTECTACHEDKLPSDRVDTGTFAVTHGPRWKTTHGLGDLDTCEACHTAVECGDCHTAPLPHPEDFGRTHGSYAEKDPQDCKTCHREPTFCTGCHTMQMPHADGFLKNHSQIAKSVSDPVCMRCHEETDCRRCHEKHVHPGGARGVPVPPRVPQQGGER